MKVFAGALLMLLGLGLGCWSSYRAEKAVARHWRWDVLTLGTLAIACAGAAVML